MTTADRLSAYRAELLAAGFGPDMADELVQQAAPGLMEDVVVAGPVDPDVPTGVETKTAGPAQ